jgi:D-glycero-D-manno-heptose 1,7-bisphosphate phosphatase
VSSPTPSDRAVFADRDGTIIEDPGYLSDPAAVRLVAGATEALSELRDRGFRLVVVSNQSGIARSLISPEQAAAVHERFLGELARRGVRLDAVRYCPHAPDDDCACRKPRPGLLVETAQELRLDLARSFMVGDKISDVEAGRQAGCTTILLAAEGDAASASDHVARDWGEVVRLIARSKGSRE